MEWPSQEFGVSVVLVAPVALTMLRPVTKQVIKGGVHLADKLKGSATESGEQRHPAVDEARIETLNKQTATDAVPVDITANITVNLNSVDLPPTERPPTTIQLPTIVEQEPD